MRKLKSFAVLLLTWALIAAGANLPRLISERMDRQTAGRFGSREMTSIALDLSGEQERLTTAGKLDLLSRGQNIAITEREASMTVAEVNAAFEMQIEQYVAAGIFEWFEYTSWITQPNLCVDQTAPHNYNIFWTVTVISEHAPYQVLMADIDDETGRIFSIRFETNGTYAPDGVMERNAAIMDAFVPIYLQQLGLMEENMEPVIEYGEMDGDVMWSQFAFKDRDCGTITIEFYVFGPGGFYNHFPG